MNDVVFVAFFHQLFCVAVAFEGQACALKDTPTGFKCHCAEKAANSKARTTHPVGKASL